MRVFDWRLCVVVAGLLAMGCNPRMTRYITLADVDAVMDARYGVDRSVNAFYDHDGRHGPEREAYRLIWVDLCQLSPCQAEARQFSEVFREIASRAAALHEVEFLMKAVEHDDDLSRADSERFLRFSRQALSEAERRVGRLSVMLRAIDVAVLVPAHRPHAQDGVLRAAAQLDDIRRRMQVVRDLLAPPIEELDDEVSVEPALIAEADTLGARMLELESSADGQLERADVVAIALQRGFAVLDAELLGRQRAAELSFQPVSQPVVAPDLEPAIDEVEQLDVWSAAYDLDIWRIPPAQVAGDAAGEPAPRWAVGGLCVGGASLLASGVLGAFAIDLQTTADHESNAGLGPSQLADREARARRVGNWAMAAGVGGVMLAGASITVLMKHRRRSTTVALGGDRLLLSQTW